jgi:hypothetical protein
MKDITDIQTVNGLTFDTDHSTVRQRMGTDRERCEAVGVGRLDIYSIECGREKLEVQQGWISFRAMWCGVRAFGDSIVVWGTALNRGLRDIPLTVPTARREAG